MSRPLTYIVGPFTAQTTAQEEANRQSARQDARILWRMGYRCVVPHSMLGLNNTDQNKHLGVTREDVMSTCLSVLSTCDCIFLMNGWRRSAGSIREYNHAQRLGLVTLRKFGEARYYLNQVHYARHKRM